MQTAAAMPGWLLVEPAGNGSVSQPQWDDARFSLGSDRDLWIAELGAPSLPGNGQEAYRIRPLDTEFRVRFAGDGTGVLRAYEIDIDLRPTGIFFYDRGDVLLKVLMPADARDQRGYLDLTNGWYYSASYRDVWEGADTATQSLLWRGSRAGTISYRWQHASDGSLTGLTVSSGPP